jgi:hypothetical protein
MRDGRFADSRETRPSIAVSERVCDLPSDRAKAGGAGRGYLRRNMRTPATVVSIRYSGAMKSHSR